MVCAALGQGSGRLEPGPENMNEEEREGNWLDDLVEKTSRQYDRSAVAWLLRAAFSQVVRI